MRDNKTMEGKMNNQKAIIQITGYGAIEFATWLLNRPAIESYTSLGSNTPNKAEFHLTMEEVSTR